MYNVVKGTKGYTAFGPFGAVMFADANKVITYTNMEEGSGPYKKLVKALAAAE